MQWGGEGQGWEGRSYLVLAERGLLHPRVGHHVHQPDAEHLIQRGGPHDPQG